MEIGDLFVSALGIIVMMLGYYLNSISTELKEFQREHHECKNSLPHTYLLKEDYHTEIQQMRADIKEDIAEIKSLISKLCDRLDRKKA